MLKFFVLAMLAATPAFAAPTNCALIQGNVVVNVVVVDPATWTPPADMTMDCSNPAATMGATLANGVYSPAVRPVVIQTSHLTFMEFLGLFTSAEQAAIINSTDTQVRLFVTMASGSSGSIDLTNDDVARGVPYLASLNLIAASRVAQILSGAPAN